MAKKITAKKRNPNDATFRNIQALKRRVNRLELRVSECEEARARTKARDTMNDAPPPMTEER